MQNMWHERDENGQECDRSVTQTIVFRYLNLIVLYIRDSYYGTLHFVKCQSFFFFSFPFAFDLR